MWIGSKKAKEKRLRDEAAAAEARIRATSDAKIARNKLSRMAEEAKISCQQNIEKAADAKMNGNTIAYKQYANGVKMALARQKRAENVVCKVDLLLEMDKMNSATKEINVAMSGVMSTLGPLVMDSKYMAEMQFQIDKVQEQMERLDANLESYIDRLDGCFSSDSANQYANISVDPEVEKLINMHIAGGSPTNSTTHTGKSVDAELEQDYERLKRLKNSGNI